MAPLSAAQLELEVGPYFGQFSYVVYWSRRHLLDFARVEIRPVDSGPNVTHENVFALGTSSVKLVYIGIRYLHINLVKSRREYEKEEKEQRKPPINRLSSSSVQRRSIQGLHGAS